jgi:hypothetical protein
MFIMTEIQEFVKEIIYSRTNVCLNKHTIMFVRKQYKEFIRNHLLTLSSIFQPPTIPFFFLKKNDFLIAIGPAAEIARGPE